MRIYNEYLLVSFKPTKFPLKLTELFLIDGVEAIEKEGLCILRVPLTGNLDKIYDLVAEYINANEGIYISSKRVKF